MTTRVNLMELSKLFTPPTSEALRKAVENAEIADTGGLPSISELTSSANQMLYATGVDTWSLTDLSPFARTLLDDIDAQTARETLEIDENAVTQAQVAARVVLRI